MKESSPHIFYAPSNIRKILKTGMESAVAFQVGHQIGHILVHKLPISYTKTKTEEEEEDKSNNVSEDQFFVRRPSYFKLPK